MAELLGKVNARGGRRSCGSDSIQYGEQKIAAFSWSLTLLIHICAAWVQMILFDL